MNYILGLLAGAALFIGGFFVHTASAPTPPSFGVALPSGPALFETSLASRISSTDTSMTLVANSVRGGESISGYNCFTIDEGRSDSEYVCGSVSGTAVTALERGLSLTTGTSSITALKFIHRAGANVKITDFPLIQRVRNQANGNESYPNIINYTYSPDYSAASTTAIASKGYVDGVAFSGAPNSNETTKGISELATAAEAGSGASTGSTGARLVLPASLATSTCQTAAYSVLVTALSTGKLPTGCFDPTGSWIFTGANTFASTTFVSTATTSLMGTTTIAASASSKLVLNGVPSVAPSSQGAVNSFLKNDGSGNWSWTTTVSTGVVSTSTIVAAPTSNGAVVTKTVFCVSPKLVSGGGYSGISNGDWGSQVPGVSAYQNYPDSSSSWTVSLVCPKSGGCASVNVTVYALCVNP